MAACLTYRGNTQLPPRMGNPGTSLAEAEPSLYPQLWESTQAAALGGTSVQRGAELEFGK